MDKRTGTIITIVLAVIFGCCALFSCIGGVATLLGGGTMTLGDETTELDPVTGIVGICFSIIFIAIPVAAYFFLVRGKNGTAAPPPAM